MPTMTKEQRDNFLLILADKIGFEAGETQSVNESDLLDICVACWNAGAEAMGTATEMQTLDYFEGEQFSMWVQAAKKATTISDAT